MDAKHPGRRVLLGPQYDVRQCAISPDGRWVATCSWWNNGSCPVRVWEAFTGRHVVDLPLEGGQTHAAFSPDGRWLETSEEAEGRCRLWEVGSWRESLRPENPHSGVRNPGLFRPGGAFSPDSRLLAVGDNFNVIRLLDADSSSEITRLTGLDGDCYSPVCFTADGTRLVTSFRDSRSLFVFDLVRLWEGLHELGLDDQWLALPRVPRAGQAAPPLRVKFEGGELANPQQNRRAEWARNALTVAMNPFDAAANARLGELYLDDGRDSEAEGRLSVSLLVQPNQPAIRFQRARAAARLGALELALGDLDFCLTDQPNDAEARWLRAQVRHRLGRHSEALSDWDAIATWYASSAEFHLARVATYRALGRQDEGSAEERMAIELAKKHAGALGNFAWALVTGPPGTRDALRAQTMVRLAAQARPDDPELRQTLGLAQYRLGQYREAISTLEQNFSADPVRQNTVDLFVLAMCHHKQNDQVKAHRYFQRAETSVKSHKDWEGLPFIEIAPIQAEAEEIFAPRP